MLTEEQKRQAISLIGTNIQVYGHFESYDIPDERGKGVVSENMVTMEDFLRLTYDYYNSKRINYDYYTDSDAKDCSAVKRFIKKKVNGDSYNVGLEWVESQNFKDSGIKVN